MTTCSVKSGGNFRCKREAREGKATCAECAASKARSKEVARLRVAAEKAEFIARHATRTPPTIQPAESDRAPRLEMGRRIGATTILRGIDERSVKALCHYCDTEYDCDRRRIHLGTAARHGCGCMKPALRGPIPEARPSASRGGDR